MKAMGAVKAVADTHVHGKSPAGERGARKSAEGPAHKAPCAAAPSAASVAPAHSADHAGERFHHHHSHAPGSRHVAGHHLLQVEDLVVEFASAAGRTRPIDGLNVSVHAGEVVALAGPSGAGKTLLADALLGMYAPGAEVRGTIFFDGVRQTAESLRRLRGREVALVPQGVSSLDPLMRVGRQVGGDAARRAELFARYRLDASVERLYPFELSGGMARRVLLICALMSDPRLLVADEPTTGLDLELAVRAAEDLRAFADDGGGVLLITHDIELALRVADRIAVFTDGAVVEETDVAGFSSPETLLHPFSRRLWHALPAHGFRDVGDAGEGAAPTGNPDADTEGAASAKPQFGGEGASAGASTAGEEVWA